MERPSPDAYQPVLTPWGHTWRTLLMVLLSGLLWALVARAEWEQLRPLFWVDLGFGLASFVLVYFRRRWPFAVALTVSLLSISSFLAAGPAVLAAVSLATRRHLPQIAVIGLLGVLGGIVPGEVEPVDPGNPWWLNLLVNAAFTAAILESGMYIGSRRELFWTLRQRAERAEAEQDLRAAQARSTERARIAREMHDVLAHRISQISMHAGALAFREDLGAAELRSGVATIQEQANEALTDLRGVLGVLRDQATGEPLDRPQPTYADLPRLVEDARRAGRRVDFEDQLVGRWQVPDALGRTLFRIVQEGITNAGKHAPGAAVAIRLAGSPADGVDVWLRNPVGFDPSAAPGSGLGLLGLAERAQLAGGTLEHGRNGSAFVVHGWLPWAG